MKSNNIFRDCLFTTRYFEKILGNLPEVKYFLIRLDSTVRKSLLFIFKDKTDHMKVDFFLLRHSHLLHIGKDSWIN